MVRTLLGHVNRPASASTLLAMSGTAMSGSTFTRSSSGLYLPDVGSYQFAGNDVLRTLSNTTLGYNYIRNPRAEGLVSGVSPPTNWGFSNIPGTTQTVTSGKWSNGIQYVEARWVGTPTNSGSGTIAFEPTGTGSIPVQNTDTVTLSAYTEAFGNFPGYCKLCTVEFNASGVFTGNQSVLTSGTDLYALPAGSRQSLTYTIQNAACAYIRPTLQWQWVAGVPVDVTVRVALPVLEFTNAPSGIIALPPAGTLAPSIGGSGKRILLEEARTNYIRNPRAEGATPGTPGTPPTNWSVNLATSGLSSQVVGTGSEFGLPYCDIRLFGTPTATAACQVSFENDTTIAAAAGVIVNGSSYIRVVGGTLTNVGTVQIDIRQADASNVFLADQAGSALTLTTAIQRATVILGSTVASTAFVNLRYFINVTIALPVDVTLRFYAPQLELPVASAPRSPSSVMLPPVGTPGTSSRAQDSLLVPTSTFMQMVSRTNLVASSQDFTNATYWPNNQGLTITAAATAAPDSTTTGQFVVPDAVAQEHRISPAPISFTAGLPYTATVYAKAGAYSFVHMRMPTAAFGSTSDRSASFNLTNGTIVGSGLGVTPKIASVGNGWYRCSITMVAVASATGFAPVAVQQNGATYVVQSFAGDTTSGLYLWGYQIEQDQQFNGYIATTTTALTRTVPKPFTMEWSGRLYETSHFIAQVLLHISPNSGTTRYAIEAFSNGVRISCNLGGATQWTLTAASTISSNTFFRAAFSVDQDTAAVSVNGSTPVTAYVGQFINVSQAIIGKNITGSFNALCELRRVSYFPYRMTPAQLQGATT